MATLPQKPEPTQVAAQQFVPPGTRELRAQSVQRLQVGLLGLATMLLLVGLANIIMDRARQADDASGAKDVPVAASTATTPKNDPLADIGVVPSAAPSAAASTPAPAPDGSADLAQNPAPSN